MGGQRQRSIKSSWKYDSVVSWKLNIISVTRGDKSSLVLNTFEKYTKMTETGLLIQTTWRSWPQKVIQRSNVAPRLEQVDRQSLDNVFEREGKSWRKMWWYNHRAVACIWEYGIWNIKFPCTRSDTQETHHWYILLLIIREHEACEESAYITYVPNKQKLDPLQQRERRTRAMWESFKQPPKTYSCRIPMRIAQNLFLAWVCSTLVGLHANLVTFPCISFSLAIDQGQRKADPWKALRTKSPTGFD